MQKSQPFKMTKNRFQPASSWLLVKNPKRRSNVVKFRCGMQETSFPAIL